ncbi:hypothetical protein E2562_016644 [Oryza meyeriana var. granulata]|uniref:DUF6598 domain-containing protein n=1 Tax=Oryza meyeriana var. granulata TaxID=110450 RepID=A0A6G1EM41_9ORYZ|nr:hypothetical protein E2562_016644 [Oryza meyeriana var. granulata]
MDIWIIWIHVCSLRLAGGDLQRALVYGTVAARDNMEGLPNFVFNWAREDAQEVTLLLCTGAPISTALRGISVFEHVLLEFNLRLKNADSVGEDDDGVLVDACIEFTDMTITYSAGRLLRSRIKGQSGVEDTVKVFLGNSYVSCFQSAAAVYRAIVGDGEEGSDAGDGDGIVYKTTESKRCGGTPMESILLPLKLLAETGKTTTDAQLPDAEVDFGSATMRATAATVVAVLSVGELTMTLSFTTGVAAEAAASFLARFKAQKVNW